MQPFPWTDVLIILALVALNGAFAASEMAIVTSRRAKLDALAAAGRAGASSAAALRADPGRFLSTVQIGITLIGILAGAYSGASLGGPTGERLQLLGIDPDLAANVGFALVIVLTTYLSLIIGELAPKQLALRSPERLACIIAPPMTLVAQATAPLVWLLDRSSGLVFRLLGLAPSEENSVTPEEIRLVVAEAQMSGSIDESERQMIGGVLRLAERPVRGVMTPRTDVDWLDAGADLETARAALMRTPHTRLPLAEGSVDEIVGVVQARDVLAAVLAGQPLDLRVLARPVPSVPDVMGAMDALTVLQSSAVPIALVHDEYGHFEGIVTPADLLAAIAGVFRSDTGVGDSDPIVAREDGSWLLSGGLPADEMAERLGINLPSSRDYQTVAGFVLSQIRHLPETGEAFDIDGWRFEVVDLDGRKIDKVLVMQIPQEAA
jgi:putative hemolysin